MCVVLMNTFPPQLPACLGVFCHMIVIKVIWSDEAAVMDSDNGDDCGGGGSDSGNEGTNAGGGGETGG